MAVDQPNRMKWNAQHFIGKEKGLGEQLSQAQYRTYTSCGTYTTLLD